MTKNTPNLSKKTTMKPPLRVLHLEDDPRDAELIQALLESEGIVADVTRVDTREDFVASVEHGGFDIILVDYTLPSFDGLSALRIALEECPDLPVIFVSGTLSEDTAAEALNMGATDYLLKERLSRIGPSVRRALREARERIERHRAEDAARAAKARFQGILEIARDAIISVDSQQCIVLFNQGAEKVFGYTQAEAIGRPLDVLLPQRFEDVHRKHVEEFARSPDVARTMGQRREVSGRRKDGEEFPAEASISKLDLGGELLFTVILRDVSERKRAEHRLMTQHTIAQILAEANTLDEATPKLLRAVCECLVWDVGTLWRKERDAAVLRCVEMWHRQSIEVPEFEAATRSLTLKPGLGLPGRVWSSREPVYIPDVVRDDNFPRAPIAAREMLHAAFGFPILLHGEVLGVTEFFSHEIRQPDQDLLDMMATIGSQIGQFIERKQAEDALRQAQAELTHVTRVAALGELTASIAHEINQPLASVVNNASACLQWLATENLEEARQAAECIIEDGHRAAEIIQRIHGLVKKAPSRPGPVDVNQTIREVIALAHSEVSHHGVSIRTRLDDDLPPILGDRIQIQQVILNLVINAVEAMDGMSSAPRELIIGAANDSEGVQVSVEDSGRGLDPGSLGQLFEAFYTTKPHGMGMGLAISRSIVEAHGGRLWASPNVPHGAIFQFTLPIAGERAA